MFNIRELDQGSTKREKPRGTYLIGNQRSGNIILEMRGKWGEEERLFFGTWPNDSKKKIFLRQRLTSSFFVPPS